MYFQSKPKEAGERFVGSKDIRDQLQIGWGGGGGQRTGRPTLQAADLTYTVSFHYYSFIENNTKAMLRWGKGKSLLTPTH